MNTLPLPAAAGAAALHLGPRRRPHTHGAPLVGFGRKNSGSRPKLLPLHALMARSFASSPPPRMKPAAGGSDLFAMPPYTSHTARRSPAKPPQLRPQHSAQFKPSPPPLPTPRGDESDENLLEMLDATVACLRSKQMDLEALGCLEQGLWLKRRMFGLESAAVRVALRDVVLGYNSLAMHFLARAQFDQCLALLRKAEAVTAPGNFRRCEPLQLLTFNNLGCCYRKLGKLKAALKYLHEAARVGGASPKVRNLSVTHLNLCAIQSQLGRHDLALEHAQAAIFHAQDELVRMEDDRDGRDDDDDDDDWDDRMLDAQSRDEKAIALAVAYHNLAAELEFTGRGDASVQWYKKALQLAAKFRATNAELVASFQRALDDATRKHSSSSAASGAVSPARRPGGRPRSAHAASRPTSAATRRRDDGNDVSYSATVASQCYKPLKPSAAGLQYSAGATGNAKRPMSAMGRGQPAKPTRPTSARGRSKTAAGVNDRQSRYGSKASAIDQHWTKLEREHGLRDEELTGRAWTRGYAATAERGRRPQSASGGRVRDPSGLNGNQKYAFEEEEEEDDGGVFEDDEPSEDEIDESNRFEPAAPRGAGARVNHSRQREALHYGRSVAMADRDGENEMTASSDAGSSGYAGDDDPDFPIQQRLSHMEYLRRMKQLAESIQNDIPSPKAQLETKLQQQQTQKPPAVEVTTQVQAGVNRADRREEADEAVMTPRTASLCKVRARLERMRSDSLLSLLDQRGDEEQVVEPKTETTAKQETSQQTTNYKPPQLAGGIGISLDVSAEELVEDGAEFETDEQVQNGERELVRGAAARRLQSFCRGAHCRRRLERVKQHQTEDTAARAIQERMRRHQKVVHAKRDLDEYRAQVALQRQEVHEIAASMIQQLYRRAFRRPIAAVVADDHENEEGDEKLESTDELHADEQPTDEGYSDELYTDEPNTDELYIDKPGERQASLESLPDNDSNDVPIVTPRRMNSAASRIQASARGFTTRHRVAQERARQLSRLYIEQKHLDVVLARALEMEQAFLEDLSVIKIQAVVRGRQSRALSEFMFIGLHAAAGKIQSSYRLHRHRLVRAASTGAKSIAARTIQHKFRSFSNRRAHAQQVAMDAELLEVQQIAASAIQRFWRRLAAAQDHAFEEIEAATCIQALSRGHLARKSLQSIRSSASSQFNSSTSLNRERMEEQSNDAKITRESAANYTFLPKRIRELYLQSLEQSKYQEATAIVPPPQETFDELIESFEMADDPQLACAALNTIRVLGRAASSEGKLLADIVRVAQVMDRRLDSIGWSAEVGVVSVSLLLDFRDVLGVPKYQ